MIVIEETIPAEADSGIRRFSVTWPNQSRVSISVLIEREAECAGEIHPVGEMELSRDVIGNEQLANAMIQVASVALKTPRMQSFPAQEGAA
jgi:hypothetical protein